MLQGTRASQGIGWILLLSLLTLNGCDDDESPDRGTGGSSPRGSGGMGGVDSVGTGGKDSQGTGGAEKTGGAKGESSGGEASSGGSGGTGASSGGDDCELTHLEEDCTPDVFEPAPTGVLNDTGANYCRELGVEEPIDCAGTGADGEFGRDVNFPDETDGFAGFSYAKVCHSGELAGSGSCPENPSLGPGQNEWGCTLDNVTGLLWEIKANDGGPRDVSRVYSHRGESSSWDVTTYVKNVNAVGLCNGKDWRLPRAAELESLVVYNTLRDSETDEEVRFDVDWFPNTIRTVSEPGFDDTFEANYWILETGLSWQGDYYRTGWWMDFLQGAGGDIERDDEDSLLSIRLVRGTAIPYPTLSRFEISDDGSEVTDLTTGLSWKRCAEGQAWDGADCPGFATAMTVEDAFTFADLAPDWRLANAKELMSLFYVAGGAEEGSLQLDQDVFPNSFGQLPHVTSTPVPWNAWYYYQIGTGQLPHHANSEAGIVRLVRN